VLSRVRCLRAGYLSQLRILYDRLTFRTRTLSVQLSWEEEEESRRVLDLRECSVQFDLG